MFPLLNQTVLPFSFKSSLQPSLHHRFVIWIAIVLHDCINLCQFAPVVVLRSSSSVRSVVVVSTPEESFHFHVQRQNHRHHLEQSTYQYTTTYLSVCQSFYLYSFHYPVTAVLLAYDWGIWASGILEVGLRFIVIDCWVSELWNRT